MSSVDGRCHETATPTPGRCRHDHGRVRRRYAGRRRVRRAVAEDTDVGTGPGRPVAPDREGTQMRRGRGSTTAGLAVRVPARGLLLLFALGAVNAGLARLPCGAPGRG